MFGEKIQDKISLLNNFSSTYETENSNSNSSKLIFLKNLQKYFFIFKESNEYFFDIYSRPNKYLSQLEFEKNLNFVFSENEEFSLWKNYLFFSLNLNSSSSNNNNNNNFNINYENNSFRIFSQEIFSDFSKEIKNSKFFYEENLPFIMKDNNKKNEDEDKNNNRDGESNGFNNNNNNFISFERHEKLSEKISEIFKIQSNAKLMIYGPNHSGKTSYVRKFTIDELLIDVDETIEVNVK